MALKLNSSSGGSVTLQEPTTASNYTLTVPAQTSTLATTVDAGNYYAFKNRIINGNMAIDQRNAGASVTAGSGNTYTLDRWEASSALASKFSVQQSSTAPTGFVNSLLVTSLAATTPATSDQYTIRQKIEGFNIADLGWGTTNAVAVTLSFWVRSSLTGTFGGSLENSGFGRSYPFTYVINAANTWEQKSITIAGDTSGTWLTTNGLGIMVNLALGAGSSVSGTAGTWASADYRSATGATSVVGTSGATFYITGVQLEKGTVATSFDYRPYGTELALCQRYYQQWGVTSRGFAGTATDYIAGASLCVQMRATPTVAIISNSSSHSTVVGAYSVNNVYANSTVASNNQYLTQLTGSAAAEL